MNAFMTTLLSLSLSGSVLIALLLLLKPFYRERLSRKWQYYIWLIVILRLMLPFSFEADLVGGVFGEAIGPIYNEAIPAEGIVGTLQAAFTQAQDSVFGMFISHLWLVWLIAAIVLFVRKITIYQSFVRYIKAGRAEVTDINELERFGRLIEREKIRGPVRLYTNSLISSPLLIGFFRPYIVLPTLDISDADYKNIIAHELAHYKRGDMFYKWLVQFVICLHWFNPLVRLMGREISNACEFSCDEAVTKNLSGGEIAAYGDTYTRR